MEDGKEKIEGIEEIQKYEQEIMEIEVERNIYRRNQKNDFEELLTRIENLKLKGQKEGINIEDEIEKIQELGQEIKKSEKKRDDLYIIQSIDFESLVDKVEKTYRKVRMKTEDEIKKIKELKQEIQKLKENNKELQNEVDKNGNQGNLLSSLQETVNDVFVKEIENLKERKEK